MKRIALTALFAFTTWFGQAQNLTVSINGGTALTDQASLEEAINASGEALSSITSIEITAGTFTADDWTYLKSNKDALSSLESFTITDGISSVADMPDLDWESCFSPSINEVSVDASFAIGACAFYECRNLASISMPKATRVGSHAFYDCSSLTSVDLPSATTIDYEAFCYCSALTTVSLPAAISIFNNAFQYCYVLADVDLPVATSIGMYAFRYCQELTSVSLPAATNIGSWAFIDCALLAFLELGTTPPTVGDGAFNGCRNPRCLTVDASAADDYRAAADGDNTDNLWYGWRINDPIIPLTVRLNGGTPTADNASLEAAIASSGLALADITSIEITAGDFLADNWEYLSQNRRALSSLTKFTIADGITSVADMPDKYSWDAYFAQSTVEEVYIAKLEKIGDNAFYYCSALTTVSLPAATSIGGGAFDGCGLLTFLELGDTPPSASDYTFNGCASPRYLKLIDADGNPLTGDALNSAVEAYKSIDDGDNTDNLWHGWRINEQPAPFTVKVNGQSAEHSAPTLQEAIALSGEAPARITQLELLSGDLRQSDADYMVNSLTALQRLTLATATEFNVRLTLQSLTELHAPLLEIVGDWAFRDCSALTSVSLPAATSIGYGAYDGCGLLTFLELGTTPPTVEDRAFWACASPRYLTVDDSAVEAYKSIDDGDPTDNLWYGWRINEQPALFTVKVNGQSAEHSAPTLQQAIGLSGIASVNVTQLQLLSGDLRQSDADYMENSLTGLQRLTLATATEFNVRLTHQSLTELHAPLLEIVGDWAFQNCSALTSVNLPAATSIGEAAFFQCSTLTTVSLPAATSIGETAFYQCSTLTAVSLPVAASIGRYAFYGCTALTTVSLPAATSIGSQAFRYCSALTTVSLPSATNIGDMAFAACSMLTFLELGTTPPTLGYNTFGGCPSPRYLAVDDSAADDYRAADDGDPTDNLWHGWRINEQPAPFTVKVNGLDAEHSAPTLQEAIALSGEAPARITQLLLLSGDLRQSDADYMVNSLTGLQRLTLTAATEFNVRLNHPSLQEFYAPNVTTLGSNVFMYSPALTTVSLPAATSIGDYAFAVCSALTTVSLPSATNMGTIAFGDCIMLTFLELGTTPPTLGYNTFGGCPSPRYLTVDDSAADDYRAADDGDDTDNLWYGWSINEQPNQLTIKVNGLDAEHSAPSLQEAIALSGEEVASITQLEVLSGDLLGVDADYMCNSLTALQRLTLTTATEFGLQLQFHPSLQEIHAPQLEIVGSSAFYHCSALTTVDMPLATSIGGRAFYECRTLTIVDLPSAISIGDGAFSYCYALTSVSLPAATSIGMEAFIYCTALDSVNIQSATSIADGAFYGCSNLTFLELGSTPPSLGDRVFNYCPSPRYLTVDASAEDAYRNIDDGDPTDNLWHGWRINEQPAQFTVKVNGQSAEHSAPTLQKAIALCGEEAASITQLELLSGDLRQSDADYMMNSLTALQRLTLTAATEFNVRLNHPLLQEFYAPNVTTLGSEVFLNSPALTTVSLPAATSIGYDAFGFCSALTTVSLPSATSIGNSAFYSCSALTFLELGATPPSLGNRVFNNCPSPRYLTVDASAEDAYRNIDDGDTGDNLWHGWSINEHPNQLTIKVNGQSQEYSAPSLQEAIALSGEEVASITQLEVLSGDLLGVDADYMRNSLTALQRLILTTATEFGLGLEHRSLQEVYAPMLEIVGEYAFSGCYALTSLELTATPPTVASSAFGACPSPRYLKLVDANGNPLTGAERTAAIANYKGDSNWSNRTSTWCGWSIEMSITATANIAESGTVSGTGNMPSGATATLQATPSAGYRFVRWTDGTNELSTDNPYSFIVTDDAELVAEFEIATYTLTYTASEGGSISGETTQTVTYGQSGTEVEAVPNEGYQFLRWSDGLATAKRTDSDVQGDMSVTAIFELIPTYTLTYTASEGGSITGSTSQTVREGQSGTEVEAVANEGYRFVQWSDGLATAKRIDSNVSADLSVTAEFEKQSSDEGGSSTGLFDIRREMLSVYPNPTQGAVWVTMPELAEGTAAEVMLFNANGQLLQRVPARSVSSGSAASRISINLSGYPSGMYIIRVGNAMAKVVKQ